MHVNRIQSVAVIDHHVISHGTVVGRSHHGPIVGRHDRRSGIRREIHAVMELVHAQRRMDAVAILRGNTLIGSEGHLEHAAVIAHLRLIQLLQLLFGLRRRSLQRGNRGILFGDIRFIFRNSSFFVIDVGLIGGNLRFLLRYQSLQTSLFLLYLGPGFLQNLLFFLESRLTGFHQLSVLDINGKLLLIIGVHLFNIADPVQKLSEAVGRKQHFQQIFRSPLIGILNPDLHGRILFFLLGNSFLQLLLCFLNFSFLLFNQPFQLADPGLNLSQIAVQLHHICLQIILCTFQLVHHRLNIGDVCLNLLLLLLRLADGLFLFLNALLQLIRSCRSAFNSVSRPAGQKQRTQQKRKKCPSSFSVFSHRLLSVRSFPVRHADASAQ